MTAVGALAPSQTVLGHQFPRIAPPPPLRHRLADFNAAARKAKIKPYPWQEVAGTYLTALDRDDRRLYRNVAIVVGRQNGKTTLLIPFILDALTHGRRIIHTAQNAKLPRDIFYALSDILEPEGAHVRVANGQESIDLDNGGRYRIVAPTRGGARGNPADIVIIDELREFNDWEFIRAARPTITASPYGQIVYLSNAGTVDSLVLNALKSSADDDPNLAYLEWSAEPERPDDDIEGWAQANPTLGHNPAIMETLQADYIADKLAGTLSIFETEHLCRWVNTLKSVYVAGPAWMRLFGALEEPRRPYMAVSMDPTGTRASAVIAYRQTTGHVGVRVVADVTGSPIDVDALGTDLKQLAAKLGVVLVAFDPWTDADIARRLTKTKALTGRDYAVACENFVRRVSDGSVRWDGADAIGADLAWTTRKEHESGAYHATRVSDEQPITAALAAIRAVWLATSEKPPAPKVL